MSSTTLMRLPIFALVMIILTSIGRMSLSGHAQEVNEEARFLIANTHDDRLLTKFIEHFPDSRETGIAQERLTELQQTSAFPVPRKTKTFRVTPETVR